MWIAHNVVTLISLKQIFVVFNVSFGPFLYIKSYICIYIFRLDISLYWYFITCPSVKQIRTLFYESAKKKKKKKNTVKLSNIRKIFCINPIFKSSFLFSNLLLIYLYDPSPKLLAIQQLPLVWEFHLPSLVLTRTVNSPVHCSFGHFLFISDSILPTHSVLFITEIYRNLKKNMYIFVYVIIVLFSIKEVFNLSFHYKKIYN